MKLYDLVKELLTKYPELRDSDKKLLWNVWGKKGHLSVNDFGNTAITKESFLKSVSAESITRARRKVQEQHPELRASKAVEDSRKLKAEKKGMFIFED